MIIYKNGSFVTRDGDPEGNFADAEYKNEVLVINDNSEMAKAILLGKKFAVVSNENKVESITLSTEEVIPQVSELEQLKAEVAELKNMLEVEYLGHKLPVEEIITK